MQNIQKKLTEVILISFSFTDVQKMEIVISSNNLCPLTKIELGLQSSMWIL